MHSLPQSWLLPSFFVLFPIVWCVVLALLSAISGWRSLGEHYRAEGPPPPGRQWLVSGSMGWVDFSGSLIVGHSDAGLHLAAFPLFRPFLPPLLIPWSAISARRRSRYWLRLSDTIEIAGDRTVRLRLPVGATAPFERHLPPLPANENR
jgi:hypothetical protein